MIRKTLAALGITLLCLATVGFAEDTDLTQEQIDKGSQEAGIEERNEDRARSDQLHR